MALGGCAADLVAYAFKDVMIRSCAERLFVSGMLTRGKAITASR